jgi:glycosyltransferase involved in cell wall biosynthesis
VSVIYPGVLEGQVDAQLRDPMRIAGYRQRFSANHLPLIGMFGRISRWKGQEVFLRAIARLPNVNAVIAGAPLFGESQLEKRLEALACELGVEQRVTFAGHIEDPLTLMAACDVVAHCSTAPEPFGLVIAEAMLSGTPVVASDAGGVREIVQPGETGVVTPPGDADSLARAIQAYLDRPEWARRLARNARASARMKFTAAAMTNQFRQVMEGL